ncbi:unnamed protein product [Camellia sinensis]
MATASATLSPATITAAVGPARSSQGRKTKTRVNYIGGLNSFGGLKAHNNVASLGLPLCTEHSFANIVSTLKFSSRGSGGGALSSTCNAAEEIFRIAAIMNGLVLVGVALGFALLRIEASVEEAAEALIGGNYGLLNTTTFIPNPDYYGALLWHRLMGKIVLQTTYDSSPYLRVYSHCSKKEFRE